MAMRAVKEKCPCGAQHTGSIEADLQIEVQPKSYDWLYAFNVKS